MVPAVSPVPVAHSPGNGEGNAGDKEETNDDQHLHPHWPLVIGLRWGFERVFGWGRLEVGKEYYEL